MDRVATAGLNGEGIAMTQAQASALMVVFHQGGPMTAAEIAAELGVTQATMTRFIKALVANGWITRERDPKDARALLIRATAKAYRRLPAMIRVSNAMLDETFADLTPTEVTTLVELVARLRGGDG